MNWTYSGSEQLDPPYYDEDEIQSDIELQEEADEEKRQYMNEIAQYD